MYYSKNNIITKISGADPAEYAILNPLTGSFDLMSETEYNLLMGIKNASLSERPEAQFLEYLFERGYLFAAKSAEDEAVRAGMEAFQAEIDNSQVQLLLISTYGCNLACTYCYQRGVGGTHSLISQEAVDAFFDYAENHFGQNRLKPFITLFGGEPLISSPAQKAVIKYIVARCNDLGYEIAVVTNGFDLLDYLDILAAARVKEIQVTLDGSREIHNRRRGSANGKGTFDRIAAGIAEAVKQGIPINFRTVVDEENIDDIVNLAEFLDEQGWLDLGPERFKTQIGRNYELFECYAKPQHLMSQVELWAQFSRLSREYPVLKKFHRPDFKGIKHLVDTGELPMASFDTCPAAKTEWVFDLNGDIFGCTASCGRAEYKLGTYYPAVSHEIAEISQWQKRNVLNIEECVDCSYNVICGGGCGVVAVNKHGKILSPDCRPIQEIVELGVQHYIDDIRNFAEDVIRTKGCAVCGEKLLYSTPDPIKVTCAYCGQEEFSHAVCKNGHFVCDDCHQKDIVEWVENLCLKSELKDPVALANQIFEIPTLKMHGPEYHSIVPAVLVTALGNITGKKEALEIKEAIRRGLGITGGMCGTHGACGAAIGAGAAYSVRNKVTPLSMEKRGEANRLTGAVLSVIGEHGGPRCCKRESILAIKTARQFFPEFSDVQEAAYVCRQFKENKECLKLACPFFPRNNRKGAV